MGLRIVVRLIVCSTVDDEESFGVLENVGTVDIDGLMVDDLDFTDVWLTDFEVDGDLDKVDCELGVVSCVNVGDDDTELDVVVEGVADTELEIDGEDEDDNESDGVRLSRGVCVEAWLWDDVSVGFVIVGIRLCDRETVYELDAVFVFTIYVVVEVYVLSIL